MVNANGLPGFFVGLFDLGQLDASRRVQLSEIINSGILVTAAPRSVATHEVIG